MCKGCFLSIALKIKKAKNEEEEEAVKKFMKEFEEKDPRGMRLEDYFVCDLEDRKFILNHSFEPNVVGHLVLQPVEHILQLHESPSKMINEAYLGDNDSSKLILNVRRVFKLLEECLIRVSLLNTWSTSRLNPLPYTPV